MSVLGKWTAKGLPRPAWSSASGAVSYGCDLWPRTLLTFFFLTCTRRFRIMRKMGIELQFTVSRPYHGGLWDIFESFEDITFCLGYCNSPSFYPVVVCNWLGWSILVNERLVCRETVVPRR